MCNRYTTWEKLHIYPLRIMIPQTAWNMQFFPVGARVMAPSSGVCACLEVNSAAIWQHYYIVLREYARE